MGSAALYQLAKRGASVIGIDVHRPPHIYGSTHGESRITRCAVGEGADYAPLVIDSHRIWRELESELSLSHEERLFDEVGFLMIQGEGVAPLMRDKADFFATTIAVAEHFGIAHGASLRAGEIRERFPTMQVRDRDIGFFEPGGGYVRPERCVAANLTAARRHGIEPHIAEVLRIDDNGGRVVVTTSDGVIEAKQLILSAGAWNPQLLGAPIGVPLTPTRQVMHWFPIAAQQPAWAQAPVYIWVHGTGPNDYFYGFPEVDGTGAIKAAAETEDAVDPDTVERSVSDAETARFFDTHIAGRLAGLDPRRIDARTCLYTQAPASRFAIGRLPGRENIVLVSACSGHGFKHSAGIGNALSRVMLGEPETRLDAFAAPAGLLPARRDS